MTPPAHPLDRKRLWLFSFVCIAVIVALGYIMAGPAHVSSPILVRLMLAAIVTAFAAVAKFVAGTRAAAATAVVGVLIWVVLASQVA
jgi:hypothetical protein